MQLVKLTVKGFRRFRDAEAQLHGRLIALVGPNEAGKSSLLDALRHLNEANAFDQREISRDQPIGPEDVVLSARFWLDDDDRTAIGHLPGGKKAKWYVRSKRRNGSFTSSIQPGIRLEVAPRRKLLGIARRVAKTKWATNLLRTEMPEPGAVLDGVVEILESDRVLTDTDRDLLRAANEALDLDGQPRLCAALRADAILLADSEPKEAPDTEARNILLSRRPFFLKFEGDHLALQSVYELTGMDFDDPPAALSNLVRLAHLDLPYVGQAILSGDHAAAEKPIEDANSTLLAFFGRSWTQSGVSVRLSLHQTQLHILISTPAGPYTSLEERSDGLRSFVALACFAEVHGIEGRPLVLLIDEAETHLHYNAQADLIRVLDLQQAAESVIYTTHSAGCLPEDLGSTVRVVVRVDDIWSDIQNSFWTKGVGFDPLLLGMGASALVFGAVRRAVVAEGAADLILLPSLLKEANRLTALTYQVAPGVAEVSGSAVDDLELQSAKAAYVVDGDQGGRDHASKLRKAGIDPSRIFALGRGLETGLAVEDLVRKDLFARCVNDELEKSGRLDRMKVADIPAKGRSAAVKKWCISRGYSEPRKVAVAHAIALDARIEAPVLTPRGRTVLKDLHSRLMAYLGPA